MHPYRRSRRGRHCQRELGDTVALSGAVWGTHLLHVHHHEAIHLGILLLYMASQPRAQVQPVHPHPFPAYRRIDNSSATYWRLSFNECWMGFVGVGGRLSREQGYWGARLRCRDRWSR